MGRVPGAVLGYLQSHGVEPAGPPYALARNADTRDLDIEAGWPVPRELPGTGEIVSGEIAESPAATCVHVGSYEGLAASHDGLKAWMEGQGLEGEGVAYEFYLDDPRETPVAERRTRISYPLRSDSSDGQ